MYINVSSTTRNDKIFIENLFSSSRGCLYSETDRYLYINSNSGLNLKKISIFSNDTKSYLNQKKDFYKIVKINTLISKKLSKPIDLIIEFDEKYYIARSPDLPIYSCGDDICEAIQNIKYEIETLYSELQEDDNYSKEWINYRDLLKSIIIE